MTECENGHLLVNFGLSGCEAMFVWLILIAVFVGSGADGWVPRSIATTRTKRVCVCVFSKLFQRASKKKTHKPCSRSCKIGEILDLASNPAPGVPRAFAFRLGFWLHTIGGKAMEGIDAS